ncbi:hypothetical protein RJ640_012078, partial [Escallonia rubra]
MEFPHHHHGRGRVEEEEEEYPPPPAFHPHGPPPAFHPQGPPPPSSYYAHNEPPPPQVSHVYHTSHLGGGEHNYQSPPPPQVAHVSHTSHVGGGGDGGSYFPPPSSDYNYQSPPQPPSHGFNFTDSIPNYVPPAAAVSHEAKPHHFQPHMPAFVHHTTHHQGSSSDFNNDQKPPVRVFSKAETNYSLAIRDGKVILAPSDPSDPFQHWVKDEKYSTRVKDEEGFPSFALVNKATGQAMKHSVGATHPVQLIPYYPDVLDESVLWTQSKDLGDSFRTIRMVNNIRLNVDAFNGDKNHGGVHNGTTIVLWEWKKGDNQRWKIIPY